VRNRYFSSYLPIHHYGHAGRYTSNKRVLILESMTYYHFAEREGPAPVATQLAIGHDTVPVLSTFHAHNPYNKIYLNVIFPSPTWFPSAHFLRGSPNKIQCVSYPFPILSTCTANRRFLDFNTLTMLQSSSFCRPNILTANFMRLRSKKFIHSTRRSSQN
jgi:hypothetical protein